MAVAGCVGWIVAVQLVDVAEEIPGYSQNIHAKMEALRLPTTGPFGLAADSLREIGSELAGLGAPSPAPNRRRAVRRALPRLLCLSQIVPQPASGLDYLREMVQPILRPLGMAGLVLIFTFFMLAKRFDLRNRLLRLVGLGQINMMTQALDDAAQRVSRYLSMQILVNTCFGTLFGFGLYLIGVPNPALWGVVAGILRIVPYVGTMIAASLPIALSLAAFNSWVPPCWRSCCLPASKR